MDHAPHSVTDASIEKDGENKTGSFDDHKHVLDFIQNEVESYDNVYVPKNIVAMDAPANIVCQMQGTEEGINDPLHVDLINGSVSELKFSSPSTPSESELLKSCEPNKFKGTSESASEFDEDGLKTNSDLLHKKIPDDRSISTFDSLTDIEKPNISDTELKPEINVVSETPSHKFDNFNPSQSFDKIIDSEEPHKSAKSEVLNFSEPVADHSKEIKSVPNKTELLPKEQLVIQPDEKSESTTTEKGVSKVKSETSSANVKNFAEKLEIGPKDFFSKYGLDTWFNPERLDPTVEAYIYWRDPKLSGIVFGSGLVLLLSMAYFSLISVIANTGLAILTCAIVFRIYKDIMQAVQKTPQTHPYRCSAGTLKSSYKFERGDDE